jgi:DGQHR domain-containing protein
MKYLDLLRVSWADVRRIEGERREVETYLGIERPLNPKRVAELKQYVRTVDASFPSSIILAVESANTSYDKEAGTISLYDGENVAKILDGQHRIAGLEGYSNGDFELPVTIFVDMDIENQALLFATINLEQTKVNKSLAYDLYDYARQRSPQKTAHNIVRLLDSRNGSPFKGKIKILGTAGDPGETLSQALFIDSLLPMISDNPMEDRDLLKRGKKLTKATPDKEQYLIFRNMFIDERDAEIARVLWNYFGAVEDRWGEYWREVRAGYVLNRTTGFRGLMSFLRFAYLHLAKPGGVPSREQFNQVFARIRLDGSNITPDQFPPGTAGQVKLREMLRSQAGL